MLTQIVVVSQADFVQFVHAGTGQWNTQLQNGNVITFRLHSEKLKLKSIKKIEARNAIIQVNGNRIASGFENSV
jgi:hypothetical protein